MYDAALLISDVRAKQQHLTGYFWTKNPMIAGASRKRDLIHPAANFGAMSLTFRKQDSWKREGCAAIPNRWTRHVPAPECKWRSHSDRTLRRISECSPSGQHTIRRIMPSQHQLEASRSRFQRVQSPSFDNQWQIQLRCISNLEILTREMSVYQVLCPKRSSYLRTSKHHRIYQRPKYPPLWSASGVKALSRDYTDAGSIQDFSVKWRQNSKRVPEIWILNSGYIALYIW